MSKKCLLTIMLAALFCLGAAGAARACKIYNHTDYPIKVELDCGAVCGNTWYIDPGATKSRPGKSGTVYFAILDKKYAQGCVADKGSIKVDKHGWVSFYQRKGYFLVKSWKENGGLKKKIRRNMYD